MEMVYHEEIEKENLKNASAITAELQTRFKGTAAVHGAGDVKKSSSCTFIAVSLAVLCLFLLGLLAVASLYIRRNSHLPLRINYNNLATEMDQLQQRYDAMNGDTNNLQRKIDDIEASCKNLTEESNGLKRTLAAMGWKYFRGNVYHVSSTEKTWQASRDDCLQKGADLIIINNREEQKFTNKFEKHLWIGLTDSVTEGTWKWVDGTPLGKSYWGPRNPNGGRSENCAHVNYYTKENSWADLACTESHYWVCEKKVRP